MSAAIPPTIEEEVASYEEAVDEAFEDAITDSQDDGGDNSGDDAVEKSCACRVAISCRIIFPECDSTLSSETQCPDYLALCILFY